MATGRADALTDPQLDLLFQSGWGREFGREGLDAYLKTKAISVNIGPRREPVS